MKSHGSSDRFPSRKMVFSGGGKSWSLIPAASVWHVSRSLDSHFWVKRARISPRNCVILVEGELRAAVREMFEGNIKHLQSKTSLICYAAHSLRNRLQLMTEGSRGRTHYCHHGVIRADMQQLKPSTF